MTDKCELCGKKIEETFLGKLNGTIVKIKKNEMTESHYICNDCQKKFKNSLKEELTK